MVTHYQTVSMIRRIQTVYLTLAVAALVVLASNGVVHAGAADATFRTVFRPVIFAVTGLAAVMMLASILLFKDRIRQRRAIIVTQLILLTLMVILYGGLYASDVLFVRTTAGVDVARLVGVSMPLVAYVCCLFARRAVTRDIERIRSMDRLR